MAYESDKIIELLNRNDIDLTSAVISQIVKEFKQISEKVEGYYNRYMGEVKIKSKKSDNKIYKSTSKIASGLRKEIVEQCVDYLTGTPIKYNLENQYNSEQTYSDAKKLIADFNRYNSIEDLDSTTAKFMGICGYASRLIYIDEYKKIKAKNILPWLTYYVYDETYDEISYAFIIYKDWITISKDEKERRYFVEIYSKNSIEYWFEYESGKYMLDPQYTQPVITHNFMHVPLIKFKNNDEEVPDFYDVEEHIDGYDEVFNGTINEDLNLAMAYLLLIGGHISPEDYENIKKTGVIEIKQQVGNSIQADARFLTKTMDANWKKFVLDTIKTDIYDISRTINFKDSIFSQPESGVARILKLMPLEAKRIGKERKFSQALDRQYEVLTDIWNLKSVKIDPMQVNYTFTRNLPTDFSYLGSIVSQLYNKIPLQTLYGLLPFVDDPEAEVQKFIDEQKETGNLIDLNSIQQV